MRVIVEQKHKGLYSAEFIITRRNAEIGNMALRGSLGSRDGYWLITVNHRVFEMQRGMGSDMFAVNSAYRTYQVIENGAPVGSIGGIEIKENWLSRYSAYSAYLYGREYIYYPIGLGKEGAKCPIYCGEKQVAQINKGNVVYDDLHKYQLLAADESAMTIALLFCCYAYTCAVYRPGEQTSKSVSRGVSLTTNKKLLSKYNPQFESLISD